MQGKGLKRSAAEASLEQDCSGLQDHVLLCGFGRTAQNLAHFLKRSHLPFVALETNNDIVREAREAGERVFHGDASNPEVLRAAGIERARVLVVTFTNIDSAERITRTAAELNTGIPTIVRTLDDRHLERLLECGADEVIPDTVESSMMLTRHTLAVLGIAEDNIHELLNEAREGNYARIRAYFHSAGDIDLRTPDNHHLHSIEILASYHAVGKSIGALRRLKRIKIIGLRRNGVTSDNPLPEVKLETGDVVIVQGHPDDIQAAEIEAMSGL